MRRSIGLAALFLACTLVAAPALEIKQGLVKVIIDETNARMSVYKLVDVAKGKYESLLFDQDPTTSYATLYINDKQAKLGDSADYRFSVTRTDRGAKIEYRSASCLIVEKIEFVSSAGAALADGVEISYSLENVSQSDATLGLRCLIDTWLGEKSGLHFRSASREKIQSEGKLDPSETWIATPGDKAELMVVMNEPGLDGPSGALVANWKRINDEVWNLDVVSGRSFTLLPYSVNDSALALYWMPMKLAKGESRKASYIIGIFNEKGYPLQVESIGLDKATETLFAQTVLGTAVTSDPRVAMEADLLSVRDLITTIDQTIASGKPLSAEQIAAWRKILESLEERRKGY